MIPINIGEPWMWAAFIGFIIAMLAVDLFGFGGRKAHRVSVREALAWVIAWIALALFFSELLFWYLSSTVGHAIAQSKTLEFLTGYVVEKSLSVDNMFIFVMIFKYFAVPLEFQRRTLIYGVLGAIVMRAIMIFSALWLIKKFAWLLYVFGALLVVTGIKMLIFAEHKPDIDKNPLLRFLKSHMRIVSHYHGEKFFVKQNGILWATPMFLVLILIETTDLVFAIDSIPAIFAITTDPFIVFTSNIFAIMGLRSLYFLLANMADRFKLLKYGLAIVLIFIGGKMLVMPWVHIPIQFSLMIVGGIILTSITLSLLITKKTQTTQGSLHAEETLPALIHTGRDTDDRLISVSIDCGRPLPTGGKNIWLLATDGSKCALRAITETIHLCAMQPCAIHLINVQSWLSKEVAESELQKQGWDAAAKAREMLDKNGVPWCLHIVMGEPAESIVALAGQLNCNMIILGSHGLDATKALLLGSVAYQVIHLSSVSVLVVR